MSIEKYSVLEDSAGNPAIYPDPEGEYVLHEDYEKLKRVLFKMVMAYCNKGETFSYHAGVHAIADAIEYLEGDGKELAKGALSSLGAGQI